MERMNTIFLLLFISLLLVQADAGKVEGAAAVVGGASVLAAVTMTIGAIGFGPAGIAAGSYAASMMSAAATTGVGAGAVAVAQSVGAAGFALGTKAVIATTGAAASYKVTGLVRRVIGK